MTRSSSIPFPNSAERRERRLMWLRRGLSGAIVAVALTYTTLPLWLPTNWLRTKLQADLSRQIGCPVRIGRLRAGWMDGVVLEDLSIAADSSAAGNPLLKVGSIRCELAPVTILAGRKLRELQIGDPEVWLDIDEKGQLNLARPTGNGGGDLPSWNYSIRGLLCHVQTPKVGQTFRIDKLDVQLDPPSGLLHLTSVTRVSRPQADADEPKEGRLDFDANVHIPRLKKPAVLSGEIRVEWTDLALSDLPVPLMSQVPVEQVDGTSSGVVVLETHPDLGVDYTLNAALAGVQIVRPELNRPAQVPDATLACAGHWDPSGSVLTMKELLYETPGVKVQAAGPKQPVLRLDDDGAEPFALRLKGRVKDWAALQQEVPDISHALRQSNVSAEGAADFAATVIRHGHEDTIELSLDAAGSAITVGSADAGTPDYVSAALGEPKRIHAVIVRDRRAGLVRQPACTVDIGPMSLEITGESQWLDASVSAKRDTQWLTSLLPSLRASIKGTCRDIGKLRQLSPWLAVQAGTATLAGPCEWVAGIDAEGRCSRLHVGIDVPADAELSIEGAVEKAKGTPLSLRTEVRWPYADGDQFDPASFELTYGTGRVELHSVRGGLKYQVQFADRSSDRPLSVVSAQASWQYRLQVRAVEELLRLSPRSNELFDEAGVAQTSGDLELDGGTELSYQPQDLLLRTSVRMLADNLNVHAGDLFDKDGNTPLSIDLQQRSRFVGDGNEHDLTATVHLPGGTLASHATLASSADHPQPTLQRASARANIENAADLMRLSPRLTRSMQDWTLSGPLTANIESIALGDCESGSVALDLTHTGITETRNNGANKPTGMAARAQLHWRLEPATDGSDARTCTIESGSVELGTAGIDNVEGQLTLADGPATNGNPFGRITQGTLSLDGAATFADEMKALHPALASCIDDNHLSGRVAWQLTLQAQPDTLVVSGEIDASEWACSLPTGDPAIGVIIKTPYVAADGAFTLLVSDWRAAQPSAVVVKDTYFKLAGNLLSLDGRIDLTSDYATSQPGSMPFVMGVQLRLAQPDALPTILPDALVKHAAGEFTANLSIDNADGSPQLRHAKADFYDFEIGTNEDVLHLAGGIELAKDRGRTDELTWQLGQSSGTFSGDFTTADGRSDAVVGFNGRQIHVDKLVDAVKRLSAQLPAANTSTANNSESSDAVVRQAITFLRTLTTHLDMHIDTLVTPLPLQIKATADSIWQQLDLKDGEVLLNFGCFVDGGCVNGKVTANLVADEPTWRLTYTADRLQPGPVVNSYLHRTFPGMIATGPLTLIDESNAKLLPKPGESNYETGKGELIIDGGTVTGRAAPVWVTRIFPGLNLASFEFSRLRSWFDKTDDGRVHHQMIYQGTYYNVYMIGWSDQSGKFNYEVGIDFLAGLESEYWANSGQGRVPLFTKTGQVMEDGRLDNEVVSFVSLKRVLETLFLRNNPVVTAYYAVQKRVRGGI